MFTRVIFLAFSFLLASPAPNIKGYFPFNYAFDEGVGIRATSSFSADQIRLFDKEVKSALALFPATAKEISNTICTKSASGVPVTVYVFGFKPKEDFVPYYFAPNRTAYGNHDNLEFDLPRLLGEWLADSCGVNHAWRKFVGVELQRRVFKDMDSF